ncbi:C3 and PZP-like alpha-2-macroglobulin domain-containing protein 8 [Dendronephthya gigantea]|uniref:C3 and PZP-like alpha-2-macroglobulin domain-containing protein 8 n=1 Tax=Dendronephthya gigantea TaxID=151771 RepID=UPI00106B0371|nr:C3 and PZP-like alpha-2-macroglobulin domain-containing protein 8 [Dendronephthya gigantea]
MAVTSFCKLRNNDNRDRPEKNRRSLNITGCAHIDAKELINSHTPVGYYLHITAMFTEISTGVKIKETARSPNMVLKSKAMSLIDVPQKFKPGFPIKFKVQIKYLDGTPVTDGTIRVDVSERQHNVRTSSKIFRRWYSVANGVIVVPLENVSPYAKALTFTANYNSDQLLKVKTSNSWYSPSLCFLKLVLPDHGLPAKVGSEGSVKVFYTVPDNMRRNIPFFYKILCKGNLLLSGVTWRTQDWQTLKNSSNRNHRQFTYNRRSIAGRSMNKFELYFNVTQEMVPSCRILVYFVKMDKETIGDSVVYDVEDKLENQLYVNFVDEEKKPGEKTTIVMKAKPGSRVAISALDKSVLLLKESDEISKKEAINFLNLQEVGPMNSRQYFTCSRNLRKPARTNDQVSQIFNNAGVNFVSNLRIFTRPCIRPRPRPMPRRIRFWRRYFYEGRTKHNWRSTSRRRNAFLPHHDGGKIEKNY